MATKHEQIIQYIETLPVGEKISVRGIAKQLNMSEGTAYRAIKDAELSGLVSTIERVGTIRIEKKMEYIPDMLTFREVARVTDGEILGGDNGLDHPLSKFIIGAMTVDAMERYFSKNTLIIVGNREDVQKLALDNGIAVLVTGGFKTSQEVIQLANKRELPIISTTHDTFTVATIINRSMTEQLIKKEIMTIKDIYTPIEQTKAISPQDTIKVFHDISNETGLSRFPVVYNNRLTGVVTAKDLIGKSESVPIERVMTKDTVTVKTHMSIANVSHRMVWEDIEMIPVVADNLQLLGVVTRQDIMKAIQTMQQQPQIVNTYEDDVVVHLEEFQPNAEDSRYQYSLNVQPQMINNLGTISYGVLCELITQVAYRRILETTGLNNIIESLNLNYFNLVQMGNDIQFNVEIVHQNRRSALSQVDIFHENAIVARAMVTSQIIGRNYTK